MSAWKIFSGGPVAVLILSALPAGLQGPAPEAEPEPETLTLSRAAALVLQRNPALAAARAGEEAARHGRDEAEAARYPRLTLSEELTGGNNPVYVFGSLLEQGRFGPGNFAVDSLNNPDSLANFRTSVDVRLPLLQRRAISAGIEQAKAGERAAEAQRELAEQQLRFRTVEAYYGLQLARERLRVARSTVDSALAEEKRVADLVEQGVRVRSDLLAAQAQRAEFEQQAIEAAGQEVSALAALNSLLDRPLGRPAALSEALPERKFSDPPLDVWLAEATRLRPELQQLAAEVEQRRQAWRTARGGWQPGLDLFARYGASLSGGLDGSADYTVGARLSFDLIDFGRAPRVSRTLSQLRLSQARLQQAEQSVALEVVQADQQFRAAREKLTVAAAAVRQAEEALRIVRDRHEVGITTITELLRARDALLAAELNRLRARYEQILSYARLLLGAGRLTGVDSLSP